MPRVPMSRGWRVAAAASIMARMLIKLHVHSAARCPAGQCRG